MAKEELLEFEGEVVDVLPDGRFRVKLENGHQMIAYTAGRMKKNRIRTLAGDRVTVEMTPYDLDKGRVIFRHKDTRMLAGSLLDRRSEPVAQALARHRKDAAVGVACGNFQIIVYVSEIIEPLAFAVDQDGGRRVGL